MMKLNETPVRTSKNYNINNIKIENIEMPENISEFNNVQIINENSKVSIENNVSRINLEYGLSAELTNQVDKNANQKMNIIIDSKTNKETQIEFKIDKNNQTLIDNIEIFANQDTKSTIIIKYLACKNVQGYHNGVIRVNAQQNSNVNVIIINLVNSKTTNFISVQNTLQTNAKINYTIVDFGGAYSLTNYYSNIIGENSDNKLNSIYIGKQNQIFDLNYIAELRGKKSNIDIEVQGALKDKAKKHFKGTIDFKKGCKKATGNENESCMLLSDTAKSIALPMLLCSEEDVKGNHSSSAGKVGEKELFYIMSRGFNQKEAMKLMVRAKFNKILENIKNENLKQEILEWIDEILD